MKPPRSMLSRATPFYCLLFLATLYTFHYGSQVLQPNQWKKSRPAEGAIENHRLHLLLKRLVEGENQTQLAATGISCHKNVKIEVCAFDRPVRIDTSTMTVYAPFPQGMPQANRTMRPYPLNDDKTAMLAVSPVQILQGNIAALPVCHYNHDVPALVFSSGGFTGNTFHDFDEVIVPLFLTSNSFQSRVRFIITDYKPWFVHKYEKIISHLSSHEVINPKENGSVHCFPRLVVGIHYHDYITINTTDIPEANSMLDFTQFLRESYDLKIRKVVRAEKEKPILLLMSRQHSRMFLNENEMVTMMEAMGFKVVVVKPEMTTNTERFAEMVNSCSVMVGAHGAGLTNIVFLPLRAVLVQVIGLGHVWVSDKYFGSPAIGMGLNYMKYEIEPEESSLFSIYGRDHPVVVDPEATKKKGYQFERDYYFIEQNFNIDVERFRKTLVQALGLVGRPTPLE